MCNHWLMLDAYVGCSVTDSTGACTVVANCAVHASEADSEA